MKFWITILFVCFFSYTGAQDGPPCNGPHEYRYEYTPVCPLNCTNMHLPRCTAVMETPSCQCKDGTIRDSENRKCISINECQKWTYYDDNTNDDNTKKVCQQEYEELKEWVPVCQRTCKALYAPLCAALIHEPSCVCVNGTVRDTDSGKCVLPQNCPQQQIINNN